MRRQKQISEDSDQPISEISQETSQQLEQKKSENKTQVEKLAKSSLNSSQSQQIQIFRKQINNSNRRQNNFGMGYLPGIDMNLINNMNTKTNNKQQSNLDIQGTKTKIYIPDEPQSDKQQLAQQQQKQQQTVEQVHEISKKIIKKYEDKVAKDCLSNSYLLPLSTSKTNKILIYLKEVHLEEQIFLVQKIKQMSEQSKKILDDLTKIETEIDQYHGHIDHWINKIEGFENIIEKIKSVETPFQKKAINLSKLKDYLNVERTRRR